MTRVSFTEFKLVAVSACFFLLIVGSLISLEDHVRSTRSLEGLVLDSTNAFESSTGSLDPSNPRAIPKGEAPNLPSIRVEVDQVQDRSIYGGKGDKQHLGGFTDIDLHGISPNVWRKMMTQLGVKSLIDVGCGRGISTLWFVLQGVDTLCVEGSHDALENSLLPDPSNQMVEHDFSRGPYWPAKTYDAVWSVEFLEHVGVNYHFNYISTFRKAALLFVTSSRWGGWHHVEVHMDPWWIRKYESYGFIYDPALTDQVKKWVGEERGKQAPNGETYNAQHVHISLKVFINPAVASLPEHAHLFHEPGCKDEKGQRIRCPDSTLSESFLPLSFKPEGQQQWEATLLDKTNIGKKKGK